MIYSSGTNKMPYYIIASKHKKIIYILLSISYDMENFNFSYDMENFKFSM